jgi:hypothetical protein
MARHAELQGNTRVKIFFCVSHRPLQPDSYANVRDAKAKNTTNLVTLFTLSNLSMVRKRLLNMGAQG